MENLSYCQIDPNMNAEAYRNISAADQLPVKDKHLQVIFVSEDERVLLGASNMTGRYWSGTIWLYANLSNVRDEPVASAKTESGIVDMFSVARTNKFIVGEDSGTIAIFELHQDPEVKHLKHKGYACQHDDSITSLSLFHDNNRFISSAMDYGIKVWDLEELMVVYSYQPAHVDTVTCVKAQPKSSFVFASVSYDGDALMWDSRKPKPAKCVYASKCSLTAADWRHDDENILAIGTNDGVACLIDVRKSDVPLCKSALSKKGLYRMKFHPKKSQYLAVCSNDNIVKIFNLENEFSLVHEDDKHKDFVRGLAWHNDELVTCGWDDEVFRRSLPYSEPLLI